jgi:hypothetical protein
MKRRFSEEQIIKILREQEGRAGVAGFNAKQRAHYNGTVMKVPDITKGAPEPKTLATGLNPGGAPRCRGGSFAGFLGDD